ncbi:hypothetical protein [Labedella endophytica]|uniref:Uncharacterized protein n=1 Tax=Labedella endophytica TaxID=1523160 RepID=A0A433JNI4_9MICO|nr:hypothetical protein [Labedella endophytica]RUQ96942.1 hypothetical protein ELQ94_16990 [Labedella endophytica]
MTNSSSTRRRRGVLAAIAVAALTGGVGLTAPAVAAPAPLTNLAHLDFLLDTASPDEVEGHTTYRLAEEPDLVLPWTYADARDGGTFERVGGGPLDAATGDWGQGAYNADDVSRAAVVYLRHFEQTGLESSKDSAYELLRSLAYMQTATGDNAGNVVLWMQPDGDLNPSAEPVELPDPSDSAESYWVARTLWAFGEGYAAFRTEDPEFASFLRDRLTLSREAIDRQSLARYGEWEVSDGRKVPAWLIVDGADASAEAVLGLAAYVQAAPDDTAARTSMRKLAEGIAAMGGDDVRTWPYGAVLPWTHSRSMWHAWGSQMPAALAEASTVLADRKLLKPAVADAAVFTTTQLIADGPDNGWFPTPADKVQIAYGADSRLQSLLAVAEASGSEAFDELAAVQAAWYFGANRSASQMYDPATGVTYDGLQADGSVNRNSGAESTIHGLLSMIALDSHPEVAERALGVAGVDFRDGLRLIEAEAATSTTGEIVTPASAWTEESLYSGDTLVLDRGEKATFDLGTASSSRLVEPVLWLSADQRSTSLWKTGRLPVGVVSAKAGAQGVSPVPGVLLPQPLVLPVSGKNASLGVSAVSGTTTLDALLVRPTVARLQLSGEAGATELVQVSGLLPQRVTVGADGETSTVHVYDKTGKRITDRAITGTTSITIPASGFAIITR